VARGAVKGVPLPARGCFSLFSLLFSSRFSFEKLRSLESSAYSSTGIGDSGP